MGLACAKPMKRNTLVPMRLPVIIARIGRASLGLHRPSSLAEDRTMPDASVTALRGTIVRFTGDPFLIDPAKAFVHEPDGLIVCRNGRIEAAGPYDSVRASLPASVPITDYSGCILSAGFVDTHVALCADRDDRFSGQAAAAMGQRLHLSRRGSLCRRGTRPLGRERLLRHADPQRHDHGVHLLRGLSAIGGRLVRGGSQAQPASRRRQMHDGPQRARSFARYRAVGYGQSKALIERWHGKGRLLYAITPRWAGS